MASLMFFSWSKTKRATIELSSAVDGIFMLLADFNRSRTLFKSESIYTVASLESRNLYSLARSRNICQLSSVSPWANVYSRASSFPSALGNFFAAGAERSSRQNSCWLGVQRGFGAHGFSNWGWRRGYFFGWFGLGWSTYQWFLYALNLVY